MKVIKNIIKLLALVGAVVGAIKVATRVMNSINRVKEYEHKAIGGAINKSFEDEVVDTTSVGLMCSSGRVNFKNSILETGEATLNVLARCSALQVKVPEHWLVTMDGTDMQSVISKRFIDNTSVVDAPRLNINYDLKFSALDVANALEEPEENFVEEVVDKVVEEVNEMDEVIEETESMEEDVFEETLVINDDEDTL